jgi:hypothetical protein
MNDLLEVAVFGARVGRLEAELAVARLERHAAIVRALASGASQAEVGRRLKLDRRTVWSILERATPYEGP